MTVTPEQPALTKSMDLNRFFVELSEPVTHFPFTTVIKDPQAVHHILNVIRLKAGQSLIVVDGEHGLSYEAEIVETGRSQIRVQLMAVYETANSSTAPHVTIGAALVKGQRWDWMLQKSVELGVRTIVPIESERSVVHVGVAEKKQARWQSIARSAAEQSEGLFLPHVEPPMTLAAFCNRVKHNQVKVVMTPRFQKAEPLRIVLRHHAIARSMAFAIGPEGGWTPEELDYFFANGFEPAHLGDRILRSETAALAVMSAMAYEYDTPKF